MKLKKFRMIMNEAVIFAKNLIQMQIYTTAEVEELVKDLLAMKGIHTSNRKDLMNIITRGAILLNEEPERILLAV